MTDHETLFVALITSMGLHRFDPRTEMSATLAAEVGEDALPAVATTEAVAPTVVVMAGSRGAGARGRGRAPMRMVWYSVKGYLAAVKFAGRAREMTTSVKGWVRLGKGMATVASRRVVLMRWKVTGHGGSRQYIVVVATEATDADSHVVVLRAMRRTMWRGVVRGAERVIVATGGGKTAVIGGVGVGVGAGADVKGAADVLVGTCVGISVGICVGISVKLINRDGIGGVTARLRRTHRATFLDSCVTQPGLRWITA